MEKLCVPFFHINAIVFNEHSWAKNKFIFRRKLDEIKKKDFLFPPIQPP